jgi:hypothetical protein
MVVANGGMMLGAGCSMIKGGIAHEPSPPLVVYNKIKASLVWVW